MNVEDLSRAVYFCLKKKINYDYLNIGSGEHYSIKKIAEMIQTITGYTGKIIYNKNFPDGVKMRLLNCKKIKSIGWKPQISLKLGLKKYCNYYLKKVLPKE